MSKAYDRVDWGFLIKVMRKFGFDERLLDMVYRLISNCHYSMIFNGTCSGFFKATRGLKQGDPLSPALFIIMAEALSRGLNNLMDQNKIQAFSQPLGTQKISHLSFADDILIFCNASNKSLKNLMDFLKEYEGWSGQRMNVSKCSFYTSSKMTSRRNQKIQEITGFIRKDMPFTYLGCPIYSGRLKICYFDNLIDRIRSKVEGWKTNLLSQAGKLILILHVLQSIPLHICAAIGPPKTVVREIDKILANCFWRNHDSKHHWVNWKNCCKPKEEGGLGIKRFKDIVKVQSLKIYWKMVSENSLWANFMKIKYNREIEDPSQHTVQVSAIWRRIRGIRLEATDYIDVQNQVPRWKLSNNGNFNFKDTWDQIREINADYRGKFIWNKTIPKKISVFMWKLILDRLPLDSNIKKLGVNLASKCQCCRAIEDRNHVFMNNQIASKVWGFFRRRLGMKNAGVNITLSNMLTSWWSRAQPRSKNSILFHSIPAFIAWEIWKARCSSVHDNKKMEISEIIQRIKDNITNILKLKKNYRIEEAQTRILTEIINEDYKD